MLGTGNSIWERRPLLGSPLYFILFPPKKLLMSFHVLNFHISLIDNSNALAKIKALTNFVLSGTFNTFPGTKFPGKQKVDKLVLVNSKGKFDFVFKCYG